MITLKKDVFSLVRTDNKFGSAGDEIRIIRQLEHGAIVEVVKTGNRFPCTHDDIDYGFDQGTKAPAEVATEALKRAAKDDQGPEQAPAAARKAKKKPPPPAQKGLF